MNNMEKWTANIGYLLLHMRKSMFGEVTEQVQLQSWAPKIL